MIQHTPGPWAMTADGGGFYVEGGNLLVAVAQEVDPDSTDIDEFIAGDVTEANARLIAAAPELLEALQSFPGFTDDTAIGDPWLEQMRAAIAKAGGAA